MAITHIVLFQFKADASAEDVKAIYPRMLALKDGCLHPTSQKPYIKSLTGGTNNSPEGMNNGLTHAFVVEFDTPQDRDYYVRDDPVHQGFVKSAGPIIEKAIVVDYAAGVFA